MYPVTSLNLYSFVIVHFVIFVTPFQVNNKEKVRVRCVLSHVTSDLTKKLPYEAIDPSEPLDPMFPSQAAYLDALHEQRKPFTRAPYRGFVQLTPEQVQSDS